MNFFNKKKLGKKIKYKGFVIYFVAFTLFSLLILPMIVVVNFTNLSKLHDFKEFSGSRKSDSLLVNNADSLLTNKSN